MKNNPAVAAIQYSLDMSDEDGMIFLKMWNEGDFPEIREEFPDAPEEVFIENSKRCVMPTQNLFELVTSDTVEYNAWSLKSKLMLIIGLVVRDNKLTQTEVAEKLGISQPRVSNLLKGKGEKFSIDALLTMLFKLGFSSDINFNPTDLENPIQFRLRKAVL